MSVQENLSDKAVRSRRNLLKMGGIAAAFVATSLTSTKEAVAGNSQGQNNNSQGLLGSIIGLLLGNDGHGHGHTHCFLRGTTIVTADGGRKVEDLAVGDLLPTMFGGLRPVQWIARYPFKKSDPSKPWVRRLRPVRIARSALGPNIPRADLYVTQGHAVFVDNVLVKAGALVNDITITLEEARDRRELEYFHIKLESHDVIYAEGAPCDTLLDVSETSANFAEYLRRYGPPATDERPCVPILGDWKRGGRFKSYFRSSLSPWVDGRKHVDIIRDRLEERGLALSRQLEPF